MTAQLCAKKKLIHGGDAMGIAYEFLREEASSTAAPKGFVRDFEGTMNFIIDHYFVLMGVHRAIEEQKVTNEENKEKAFQDLKAFKVKKKSLRGASLSDAEKDALAEEERDIIRRLKEKTCKVFYKGEPLSEDDCRLNVALRYSFLFTNLEKVDNLVRWPLRKSRELLLDKYPDLKTIVPKI